MQHTPPKHDERPPHDTPHVCPLQLTFWPHEDRPKQPIVHELAVHVIPWPHELVPGQLTVQLVPPHWMGPHELVPVQLRSHVEASVQSMPWPHDERPPHTTLHGTPFGHFTFWGQGVIPNVQSITQVPP